MLAAGVPEESPLLLALLHDLHEAIKDMSQFARELGLHLAKKFTPLSPVALRDRFLEGH